MAQTQSAVACLPFSHGTSVFAIGVSVVEGYRHLGAEAGNVRSAEEGSIPHTRGSRVVFKRPDSVSAGFWHALPMAVLTF